MMKLVVLVLFILMACGKHSSSLTSCEKDCPGGACLYQGCVNPVSCSGGACIFERCYSPTCSGGACIFEACHNEKCSGGGCKFIDPQTTLKEGHCDGERCTIDGVPHPSIIRGQLSI
eukprot:405118_1